MIRRNVFVVVAFCAVAMIGLGSCGSTQGDGAENPSASFTRVGEAAYAATFDDVAPGEPDNVLTFARTGPGEGGAWEIGEASDAPSPPNVLTQTSTDATADRYPLAVVTGVQLADVDLSARVKPISGEVDQAGGLVCRYRDENNYYLTRSNALEGNVRLYRVVDGQRTEFASADVSVPGNSWHTLRLICLQDGFEVHYNDARVVSARDTTITGPGSVGLWTKADSVTAFDDVQAWPIQSTSGEQPTPSGGDGSG